jgi:lipoate-protein ligase A
VTDWQIDYLVGPADELFNGTDSSAAMLSKANEVVPSVRFITVDAPVLVLGSGQSESVVGVVPRHVRRRSGGGAVWLDPVEQVWVDVIVPNTHRYWHADVTDSFTWLGHVWADAVHALGVEEPLAVHEGRLMANNWSPVLCFAGTGPGEVFARSRKLVGLSQRRARAGSLFQCGLLTKWSFDPEWFSAEARPEPDGVEVRQAGIGLVELGLTPTHDQIRSAFLNALASAPTAIPDQGNVSAG